MQHVLPPFPLASKAFSVKRLVSPRTPELRGAIPGPSQSPPVGVEDPQTSGIGALEQAHRSRARAHFRWPVGVRAV